MRRSQHEDWAEGDRSLTLIADGGPIELEQADDVGLEWLAAGPAGEALGSLRDALTASAPVGTDPDWIDAVVGAMERELASKVRRSMLLVKRATGTWYHATPTANRASIREHGLDWRCMVGPGIAGSTAPEYPGVFLCADLWVRSFSPRSERVLALSISGKSNSIGNGLRARLTQAVAGMTPG